MWVYIGRRLLSTIPVLLIVAVLVFLMLRLTPGDPASIIAGSSATDQDIIDIRHKLGLDQPLIIQFGHWAGGMLGGNFGESFFYKKTVAELIGDRIEPTLSLAALTLLLATVIAVPLGTIAAWKQNSWIDRGVMAFSVAGFSVPVFVIGYLMIGLFSIKLGWFPVQGYQRIAEGIGGWLHRLILPALTLSVIYVALIAR
ncbi:MAG TPA: ABC transporter permease, partial [Burkholderiaceae bacterium]|nr:ABC transporter permease [Burkholderiaceae bacterium]